ncbi:unnamed protein product [Acanthocheilonema viteae]|uniref:Uncharacterized protein n=1 Tax=Acanthocheilonema viteae TaxID=6277 RepID=A0A498SEL0_ACAVI|nr:unnamed protein product [Acanthocheilonema viteae]
MSKFRAECPRKKIGEFGDENEIRAPALAPEETRISCTYMYNGKSELDQLFSDDMLSVLDEITRRLRREVRVNLIVKKINCAKDEQSKCLHYSLHESFHWLIINDLTLSQHSIHDLTAYCSKEADKEVGFVRRLSDEELMDKQRKSKVTKFKNTILRSPLELNLIEPLLLERRSFDKPLNWHQLQRMNKSTLGDAINNDQLTFILFWNADNIISKHIFYLWAEASKSLVLRHPTITFGALACHEFDELCDDYITKPNDYHTVFAYKESDIFGKIGGLRDAKYYIDWVQL